MARSLPPAGPMRPSTWRAKPQPMTVRFTTTCGPPAIHQATAPGVEACTPIAPQCPLAPTANYFNLYRVSTCAFTPSLGQTSCEAKASA